MRIRVFVFILMLLLGCGCTVQDGERSYTQVSDDPLTVALTPATTFRLPLPHLGYTRSLKQLLTAQYADRTLDPILVVLELKPASLALVGFTPLGIKLFSCQYEGSELKINTLFADKVPPLGQIVLDIMLSFYPVAELNEALPAGFKLVDDGQRRLLKQDQAIIYEIEYAEHNSALNPVSIEHKVFDYKIKLTYLAH